MSEWVRVSETVEKRIQDLEQEAGKWLLNCARTDDAFSELANAAEAWRNGWYTQRRIRQQSTRVDEEDLARAVDNLRDRTMQIRGDLRSQLQEVRTQNDELRQLLTEFIGSHNESCGGDEMDCGCALCKRAIKLLWGDDGQP